MLYSRREISVSVSISKCARQAAAVLGERCRLRSHSLWQPCWSCWRSKSPWQLRAFIIHPATSSQPRWPCGGSSNLYDTLTTVLWHHNNGPGQLPGFSISISFGIVCNLWFLGLITGLRGWWEVRVKIRGLMVLDLLESDNEVVF